MNLYPIFVASG